MFNTKLYQLICVIKLSRTKQLTRLLEFDLIKFLWFRYPTATAHGREILGYGRS